MEATRRLSLTLLMVAPLFVAGEILDSRPFSLEEERQAVSGDHFTDLEEAGHWSASDELLDETNPWTRRRRSLETPGEDMETAEQILFRPIFRHRQIVEERQERDKLKGQLRRQPGRQPAAAAAAPLPPAEASRREYTFRGTPFGAVFVRKQRSINPYQRFYR